MLTFLLYLFGYLFVKKVVYPIISFGKKKQENIIFNQHLLYDIFDLVFIFYIFYKVTSIFIEANDLETWIYFIFPVGYFITEVLIIITSWNAQIEITSTHLIFTERKKYEPIYIDLVKNTFLFCDGWNNDDSTEILKYRKLNRVYFLKTNKVTINLNEHRLNNFNNKLIKVLNEKGHAKNISIEYSFWGKYNISKWLYSLIFLTLIIYYLNT